MLSKIWKNNFQVLAGRNCCFQSNFPIFITDADKAKEYDHIIFDTAPTGHTLRMLQLPSAWSTFISESTHGASCLGQLSGLEERKGIYKQAVETLSDANATRLVLVSRPEIAPLKEAARSSHELQLLGINNQLLVINGLLLQLDEADSVSKQIYDRQQTALKQTPAELLDYPSYSVPLGRIIYLTLQISAGCYTMII